MKTRRTLMLLAAALIIPGLVLAQVGIQPIRPINPGGGDDHFGRKPETAEQVSARLKTALPNGDFVVVAKVDKYKPLAQTRSMPPSIMGEVTLANVEVLKGDKPGNLTFSYSYVQGKGYGPAAGDRVVAVGKTVELEMRQQGVPGAGEAKKVKRTTVMFLAKATPDLLAAVKEATGKSPTSQPEDESSGPASQPDNGKPVMRLIGPGESIRPPIVPDHLRIDPSAPVEQAPQPGDEMHRPGVVDGNPGPVEGPIRRDGGPVRIGGEPRPTSQPDAKTRLVSAVTQGALVFTGTVEKVVQGPMAMSEPPILMMTVTFKDVTMLKGNKPETLTFSYRVTRGRGIEPASDQKLLAVSDVPMAMPAQPRVQPGPQPMIRRAPLGVGGGGAAIRFLAEATDANVDLAKKAAKLPAGWSLDEDGKAISPWVELGAKAWPKGVKFKFDAEMVCARSNRPALTAGAGVEFKVEQVIPAQVEKFKNPFGDGTFKLTVTNKTDKPLDVPALLTNDGKEILWADSVLVVERDRPHVLPGAGRLTADARPVKLAPGQSVSGEVDTLRLGGVSWPRGGSRVYFRFGLGELAQENFFYYYSALHDKMRGAGPAATDDVAGNQAGWTRLFADEQWYKQQRGAEQEFVGKLVGVPDTGMETTLQRTSYYRLGGRTIYTGAKKAPALDRLVGQRVVIRGKPYDINLEGRAVSEIWPAAVRPATDADKDWVAPKAGVE